MPALVFCLSSCQGDKQSYIEESKVQSKKGLYSAIALNIENGDLGIAKGFLTKEQAMEHAKLKCAEKSGKKESCKAQYLVSAENKIAYLALGVHESDYSKHYYASGWTSSDASNALKELMIRKGCSTCKEVYILSH